MGEGEDLRQHLREEREANLYRCNDRQTNGIGMRDRKSKVLRFRGQQKDTRKVKWLEGTCMRTYRYSSHALPLSSISMTSSLSCHNLKSFPLHSMNNEYQNIVRANPQLNSIPFPSHTVRSNVEKKRRDPNLPSSASVSFKQPKLPK